MEKERAESLIAVCPVKEHPSEYVIRGDGGFSFVMEPPSRPGRQNFKPVFFISGAIYIARAGFFKKTGRLYDGRAALYVMKRSESLDVDDPLDLGYANWFYEKVKMGAEGL
jgi:CMP-N-acetylneuraminic acid synthetase